MCCKEDATTTPTTMCDAGQWTFVDEIYYATHTRRYMLLAIMCVGRGGGGGYAKVYYIPPN